MTYISLKEYDKLGKVLTFSSNDEFQHFQLALSEANKVWKEKLGLSKDPFPCQLNLNRNSLELYARDVTGFINIAGYSLEIRPKFTESENNDRNWRIALSNLLLLQSNPSRYRSNLIQSEAVSTSLPDLLAEKYITELEKGILLGLPKAYVFKEENSLYFKGTYNTNKAIQHLVQPQYIPCKFDDYIEDILPNQVIKLAALELSKIVNDNNLSLKLTELSHQINSSLTVPSLNEIERASVSIQYGHLNTLLELSKLILLNNSLIFTEGLKSNFGFLWNTNVIFEKFVKMLIEIICKKNVNYRFTDKSMRLYSLANDNLDVGRKVGNTSPDIRVFEGQELKWLLDVKYKRWNNGPKSQDIYQVITGALLSKIKKVSLLYPQGVDTPEEQVFYNLNTISTPMYISCIFIDILKLSAKSGLNEILDALDKDLHSE